MGGLFFLLAAIPLAKVFV